MESGGPGTTLRDAVEMVRSRAAGAYLLTLDLIFHDESSLQRSLRAGLFDPDRLAELYGVSPDDVTVTVYSPVNAVKVTLPRRAVGGSPDDTDLDAAQQFVPLLDLPVP